MFRAARIALLLCIVCANAVSAQVFHDDFDGTSLDPAKWNVAGGGTISVAGGFSTQSAGCGEMFPYVTTVSNPFPTSGDFIIRVGFSYPNPSSGGNGFGAATGFVLGQPGTGYWVWQDYCCGGLRAVCGNLVVPISPAGDTGYHVYEWDYIGGAYSLYVDGTFRASDASTFRPVDFFFGHPPFTYCPWTTQSIDFVDIREVGVTPTRNSSWGRVKAMYR